MQLCQLWDDEENAFPESANWMTKVSLVNLYYLWKLILENDFQSLLSGGLLLENNLVQVNDVIFQWMKKKYLETSPYFKLKNNVYFVTTVPCFIANL